MTDPNALSRRRYQGKHRLRRSHRSALGLPPDSSRTSHSAKGALLGAKRAMAGRLSWGLADQAVSSLTNFAVGSYVARSLGVTAFGIFGLALVTYSLALNVSRGMATDPLMVRFSGVSNELWRRAVSRASGTALAAGAAAGAICMLAGVAMGGSLGHAFLCLGIMLPTLLLQDSWRF